MTFELEPQEWEMLKGTPKDECLLLAQYLGYVIPAQVSKRDLFEALIPRMHAHCCEHGFPFNSFDAMDLDELSREERNGFGSKMGLKPDVKTAALIKAGERCYKAYYAKEKLRHHPIVYLLPILLQPLARLSL